MRSLLILITCAIAALYRSPSMRPARRCRPASSRSPRSARSRIPGPLGGAVRRGRQGDPAPALPQLPPGDRTADPDRRNAPARALVVRGDGGIGAAGLRCITCHHNANFDPAGVPGNPEAGAGTARNGRQGKSLGDICRQIKDTNRNGGRSMAELVHHMAEDELVGWGWHPGGKRTLALAPRPSSARSSRPGQTAEPTAPPDRQCTSPPLRGGGPKSKT